MTELALLQAVRLKGRAATADLATTAGVDLPVAEKELAKLADDGFVKAGALTRITPEGRAHLAELLAEERSSVDSALVMANYDDFRAVNAEFKALVARWQMKDGEPNAHDDDEYDAAILGELAQIDRRVHPIIEAVSGELPRLAIYSTKLSTALERVRAGEASWLTKPVVDSYHTVWFELHEELIVASGLTRDDEAAAGHAQ